MPLWEKLNHILERQETGQFDHFTETGQVVNTFLNLLQAVSHAVTLVGDLEKRVAHGALEQKEVGHCEIEGRALKIRQNGPLRATYRGRVSISRGYATVDLPWTDVELKKSLGG